MVETTIHYKHLPDNRYTHCGRDLATTAAYNRHARARTHVLKTTQDRNAVTCQQCLKRLPTKEV